MKRKRIIKSICLLLFAVFVVACAASRQQAPTLTSEDYLKRAEEQITRKKYEEAKKNLEDARQHYRTGDVDARILALLGDTHYNLKDYNEAIITYKEFLELHPRNPLAPRVLYQIGMSYFKLIRTKDRNQEPARMALEAFTRLAESYPRSPEAQKVSQKIDATRRALAEGELFVGKFYLKKECYEGAIARFEMVLEEYPEVGFEEETLFHIGEAYRRLDNEEMAQQYFNLLLEKYPYSKYVKKVRDFLTERKS